MFWRKTNDEWREYTYELEHFKACFPGEVKRHFQSFIGVDDGESPGSILYTCDRSGFLKKCLYEIRVTRVMEYFGAPKDFLETAIDEMIKTLQNPKIQSLKFTEFDHCPAGEFRLLIKGYYGFRGMTVLIGNTLYVITVFSSPNVKTDYEKFVGSLQII